jgi:hypothetical protein
MRRSLRGIRHQGSTPFTISNAGVSVYTLMKRLGHESAAAQNRLYDLLDKPEVVASADPWERMCCVPVRLPKVYLMSGCCHLDRYLAVPQLLSGALRWEGLNASALF